MATPLKLLFAGSGEFGLPTLKALLDRGHHIERVYSQPDRPAGRGRTLTPTPIAQFALQHGLPVVRTASLNNEALPAADLLIVIAFGQKISSAVANHCRLGSVNLHASRLPKYRGAAPIHWAILRGEAQTGNSIIRLAERMDAGAVLGQSLVDIGEVETTGELHDRLAIDGASLMLRTIEAMSEGTAIEIPQDEGLATQAPKLSRETSLLNFNEPAEAVARKIRGLSPWPGCRARLLDDHGKPVSAVTLLRARPAPSWGLDPGQIDIHGQVACGGLTAIEILDLQPEGKRPMSLKEFRNGRPWTVGMALEPIA